MRAGGRTLPTAPPAARARSRFDVLLHEVLAEVVIDHVAAIDVEEPGALFGTRRRHQRVTRQPVRRLLAIDFAVQVPARRFIARVGKTIDQRLHPCIRFGLRRIQTGFGIEHVALEDRPLGTGKCHLDAIVRRPLRDERLRREQRVNRELHPSAIANQMLLEQRVVDVVAGVAFVTREIDRPVDVDRQVSVDLNQAAIPALVPVVAAPWFIGDVLDRKRFLRRQLHVRQCARPAFGDRTIEGA